MRIVMIMLFSITGHHLFAQGGWIFDTNPLNDLTDYTTIYPYVGASFVEMNGDVFVDLYAAPDKLFLNNGDGTFSAIAPLDFDILNATAGSSWADLDNDGDNDVIIAASPSKIFFNDGSANFSDSTSEVPEFSNYGSWAGAIGDYNEDPLLDFIFVHANGFHPGTDPSPCKLYEQTEPSFSSEQITGYNFTTELYSYTNPFWSDYDLDGDMDLFIASGPVMGVPDYDFCYKNMYTETGDDTLMVMTTELFATQKQDGQCYNFIDYDNDLDLDLCLTNYFSAQTRFYKNNGGSYSTITTPFTTTTTNIANCWGDYDNDGDLDVIITNDNQVTKYYNNDGDGSFTFLPGGFSTPTATNGITNADYDNDGDLDIFTNGVGNNGNTTSVGLFINDTVAANRHSVNLHLVGVSSNRSAIGAIVKLHATINGNAQWQVREVNAQNSFQGQNDLRVHFGLGDADMIDTLMINWPSGIVESYYNYPADKFYEITEGEGMINLPVAEHIEHQNNVSIYPNPAANYLMVETAITDQFDRYLIADILGGEIQSGSMHQLQTMLSVEELPAGIYYLILQSSEGKIAKQFVKLR